MNRPDKAEELFRKGYNCSQSVFAAFADVLDMTVEEAAKIASPFGAGFGKLREVCGAVSGMTLLAGTIIATGTPAGVGMGFKPPRFLQPGDVVECRIEGIGSLRNTVRRKGQQNGYDNA